jgi:predicted nucleic acid-binding protein
MGRKNYLIDTNVVIYYFGSVLSSDSEKFIDEVLGNTAYLSVINRIELLCSKDLTVQESQTLEYFIQNCSVLDLDEEIIIETIKIRKEFSLRLPDAIIAATCIVNRLNLITNNVRDFVRIPDLKIISVNCKI